jgi:DNA-binding transcriptional LysR family regulator
MTGNARASSQPKPFPSRKFDEKFFRGLSWVCPYVGHVRIEIELRQMAYFLAIAEERSFTRAAERCHVAQPSLSRQIHEMERILGAKLFDRLPRDVRITTAGELFAKEAVKTLEHSRRAISLVRALEWKKTQTLRIGLSILCDLPRMRGLIDAVQRSGDRIALECVTANTMELSLATLRGKLDLAIVDLPIKEHGLSIFSIYKEPLVVALPQKHPLVQRPLVRLFELRNERIGFISRRTDPSATSIQLMLQQGGVISSIVWAANLIDLLDAIASDQNIGLIRRSAARLRREGVVYKPLADSISLQTAIAGRKGDHRPHIQSFRDAIVVFAQQRFEISKDSVSRDSA